MGDQEILDRMNRGLFEWRDAEVALFYFHLRRRRWYRKIPDQHPESGRFRYRLGKTRRTVYRNRVAWMWRHRILVPEGFVVDHIDGDNTNDRVDNLQLMTHSESCRQGASVTEVLAYDEIVWFFEFIIFMGREPNGRIDCT